MQNTTNANGEQTEIVIENENAEPEAEEVERTSTEIMLNDHVAFLAVAMLLVFWTDCSLPLRCIARFSNSASWKGPECFIQSLHKLHGRRKTSSKTLPTEQRLKLSTYDL